MPTTAPACHISPENQFDQPAAPTIPNIPTPDGSNASMLAAIMALKAAVEALAGLRTKDDQKKKGFTEDRPKRKTDKVKVRNPEDQDQFVEVERIIHLEFTDKKTGQRIIWSR